MRILCKLRVDPVRHCGCMDVVDRTTGEVLQTAWQVMMMTAARHPDLRPCGWEEDGRCGGWAVKETCRRCPHVKQVLEDG